MTTVSLWVLLVFVPYGNWTHSYTINNIPSLKECNRIIEKLKQEPIISNNHGTHYPEFACIEIKK